MEERNFEDLLTRALSQDFSAGTERFRDALLARCLAELGAAGAAGAEDPSAADDPHAACLTDADLELLAAAGDPAAAMLPLDPQANAATIGPARAPRR